MFGSQRQVKADHKVGGEDANWMQPPRWSLEINKKILIKAFEKGINILRTMLVSAKDTLQSGPGGSK